jgi:nucleotide-binding universal stress UspA family protein
MTASCPSEPRILLCADESELGELASQWAQQCASEFGVGLLRLHGSLATPAATLTPVHPGDLLVLGFADGQGRVPHAAIDLVAAAPCLTVLIRPSGGYSPEPVTAAVSGDRSDGAVLAAALDLAARCHAELRLLHARPLPLCHSDTPEERWAAHAVLESARRQILRLAPDCIPRTELLRVHAHEAIGHHHGGLLVVGAKRSRHPGLGLVTRTALYHANSPVAVVHTATSDPLSAAEKSAIEISGYLIGVGTPSVVTMPSG